MKETDFAALDAALASARMEGFTVGEHTKNDCVKLLSGQVSIPEIVREILARTDDITSLLQGGLGDTFRLQVIADRRTGMRGLAQLPSKRFIKMALFW